MDCGKSNLINQSFKIFREIYTVFLRELFHKKFGPRWFEKIQHQLKTSRETKKHPNTYFDIPNILGLILSNWDGFMENYITRQERGYLFELRNTRNRWAHQDNISSNDLLRTFDNILRLFNLHYFNNEETNSESLEDFDEMKVNHVKKLKHYVLLKIAENIEAQYGIEKRRINPPPQVKLQSIIFKRTNSQRTNDFISPRRENMNNFGPPPENNGFHGFQPPRNRDFVEFSNNNQHQHNNNFSFRQGNRNGGNNFNNFQGNNNQNFFSRESEDISMMDMNNRSNY